MAANAPSRSLRRFLIRFLFLFFILPQLSAGLVLPGGFSDGGHRYVCRRNFFSLCSSAVGAISLVATSPVQAEGVSSDTTIPTASNIDYRAVASDIEDLIARVPYRGPPLVRLAWHSSGTYDRVTETGGSGGGTIRFQEELAHKENVGLAQPIKWLERIKVKYGDALSYADLYTMAGGGFDSWKQEMVNFRFVLVLIAICHLYAAWFKILCIHNDPWPNFVMRCAKVVAIKVMGGPPIPWGYGRTDAPDSSAVTPDGRLPGADSGKPGYDESDSAHLRATFNQMGFDDGDIVALSGAHALGRCNKWASGYDGTWTTDPVAFDNSYFVLLESLRWRRREWDGPFQYEARAVGGKALMMLPTDLALLRDPSFRKYVRLYAKDRSRFERDFSAAFQKLEELGTKGLIPVQLWT
mmetsp:Transcript_1413/g.3899  ORF Transcript_1413/g.3899 Transcript_1413/m.3899 type:complete len:410 (-) Transcript_1413:157-1386(-)|eukprot:CAMPEP_0113553132 /NCGR_PEP_ID=MMETSP0015_2-20120614/15445_1 /TAXON_ID=2838 /ORGANISM="Odontella" /LENGTH=409 /DNA_ID=CAMNT_0000454171 /DNA_START=105 /DNA_END=1334 /DNA_ORIENTATION=+ /assembly_acc=CAM_ASM_000160